MASELPTFENIIKDSYASIKKRNKSGASGRPSRPQNRNEVEPYRLPAPRNYITSKNARNTVAQLQGSFMNETPDISIAMGDSYSPYNTIQAQQIPNSRFMEYAYIQYFAKNEPRVAAALLFYTYFPLTDFKLECGNSFLIEHYEELCKKLNIRKILPLIAHEYYLRGDAFVLGNIDCPHCFGNGYYTNKNGDKIKCSHDGATWDSVSFLPPDGMYAVPSLPGIPPKFLFRPTQELKRLVETKEPKEVYDKLSPEFIQFVLEDRPMEFDEKCLYNFKHGGSAFDHFGTSLIRPLLQTLAYKDKLRQSQWVNAIRNIYPIKLVKVGDKDRPASEDDLDAVKEQLAIVENNPMHTIVGHDALDIDYVGAQGKYYQVTPEFEQIEQELLDGLGLNKGMLNGEGPAVNAATVGLLILDRRLEQIRQEVAHWLEEYIFKCEAEWNGFTESGEAGQEKLIYPEVKWNDLKLRDETGKLQVLQGLRQNGDLDLTSMLEALGLNPDLVVERLRYEQANSSVDAIGGGMGGGYGAPMAGGMPSMGGDMGGMPMPPMGGDPGGMPEGGGMGEMPQDPSTQQASADSRYEKVASLLNEIFDRRTEAYNNSNNIRLASRKIKSAAHRMFLLSSTPVTGRGVLGPLPSNMDEVFAISTYEPYLGGENSVPMNSLALNLRPRQNVAVKKDEEKVQKNLFTSLEVELYKIISNIPLPFPWYAQYQAGGGFKYQLDAAIPGLKLGIEADGKTFHNSPEVIQHDQKRDMELAGNGWTILRFTEEEIKRKPQDVRTVVTQVAKKIMSQGNSGNL